VPPAALRSSSPILTRRDLLKYGGILGAGFALSACTTSRPAPTPPSKSASADARVVVVGAGLAGVTAAYRLFQSGVVAHLYEARDRIGGRCWTARGFADGQTAEHGGEFIDSRHVHIRQLADELGLKMDDLFTGYGGSFAPTWVDGAYLQHSTIHPINQRISAEVTKAARRIGVIDANGKISTTAITFGTATPAAAQMDQVSMADWLDSKVAGVLGSSVGLWLDEQMAGWYGLNMAELSAINWVDWFVIPAPGADERWHVHGGNDQIPTLATAKLPSDTVHMSTALRAIRRRAEGAYELTFDGAPSPVIADLLILTLPFSTLRQVDLSGAGFGTQKMAAINELAMGYDAKVLLQYDRRPDKMRHWTGDLDTTRPDFQTWESSAAEPGAAGLITVYAGGRTGAAWTADQPHGPAPDALSSGLIERINQAVPGSASHFNGTAWADLWPRDQWTNGAYAAFGVGQYTRFWGGTAQPDGNAHFAGEATSTYSQGYLNGGVESGDRAAMEVLQKLGLPVPDSLSKLPH
jgi:monoamine oxidase